MDQPTILIVSDDAHFAGAVTGRWQSERSTPAFTLMGGDLCQDLDPETFAAAIVGRVGPAGLASVLKELDLAGKPVVWVCEPGEGARVVREAQTRAMVLRQHEGWLDALMLLMSEVLRRVDAVHRALENQRAGAILEQQATLGRYMLEMRHSLNNALTSVLGNSELLLQEPGSLSASARSQMDTIRNMSLRMHEILQRFSSLEKELRVLEMQAGEDPTRKQDAASA